MHTLHWLPSKHQNAANVAFETSGSFKNITKVLLMYKSYCGIQDMRYLLCPQIVTVHSARY